MSRYCSNCQNRIGPLIKPIIEYDDTVAFCPICGEKTKYLFILGEPGPGIRVSKGVNITNFQPHDYMKD